MGIAAGCRILFSLAHSFYMCSFVAYLQPSSVTEPERDFKAKPLSDAL